MDKDYFGMIDENDKPKPKLDGGLISMFGKKPDPLPTKTQ